MDVYEMFIRFIESDRWLPSEENIFYVMDKENVKQLEFIALMFKEREKLIPMDDVFNMNRKRCDEVSEKMLTALVVQHSCFREASSDGDVQKSIAAFASLSLNTSNTSSLRTPSSDTVIAEEEKLESAETEDVLPRSANTKDADVSKPRLDCFAGRNFVAETNDVFLWKSRTRIESLAKFLSCYVKTSWIKMVASNVISDRDVDTSEYRMYKGTNRFVHRISPSVCEFLKAYQDPMIKTFSFTKDSNHAFYLHKMRPKLDKFISEESDSIILLLIICSIGLPTFKLYTPVSFLKNWVKHRFKEITNDHVILNAVRPYMKKTSESKTLELAHVLTFYKTESSNFEIQETPDNVEMYMFKHWYSYPSVNILRQLVDSANANLIRCVGI